MLIKPLSMTYILHPFLHNLHSAASQNYYISLSKTTYLVWSSNMVSPDLIAPKLPPSWSPLPGFHTVQPPQETDYWTKYQIMMIIILLLQNLSSVVYDIFENENHFKSLSKMWKRPNNTSDDIKFTSLDRSI